MIVAIVVATCLVEYAGWQSVGEMHTLRRWQEEPCEDVVLDLERVRLVPEGWRYGSVAEEYLPSHVFVAWWQA